MGGEFVWLRRSQYLLHSSDPVPGSMKALNMRPAEGERRDLPGCCRHPSARPVQLIDDPTPPWRGWVAGINMEKHTSTVGEEGLLGGGA